MRAAVFDRQLALFEALRRIGFTSDEIFTGYNSGRPVTVIRAEGKQFVMCMEGSCTVEDENEYILGWREAAEWWNGKATDRERMAIYCAYFDEAKLAVLIFALDAKGMPFRDRNARAVAQAGRVN